MKRFFLVTFAFFAINTFAFATIAITTTVDGATDEQQPWFNGTNEITITVTLDGTDADTWHGNSLAAPGLFRVYGTFDDQDGGTPLVSSDDLSLIGYTFFDNNVATITLTESQIQDAADDNLTLDQKPFDLWFRLKDYSGGTEEGYEDPDDTPYGQQSGYRELSFYDNQETYLKWDVTISGAMEKWEYPYNDTDDLPDPNPFGFKKGWPFKDMQVQFKPPEELLEAEAGTATALKSYIEFVSINGADEGQTIKKDILSGKHTYADQTLSFADAIPPLVSGSTYKIRYYLVDKAGNNNGYNYTADDYVRMDATGGTAYSGDWWKFDNTPPTLSFVDEVIDDGSNAYGDGSVIFYDLNYSEGLRANGDMTITYDNGGTSPVTQADIHGVDQHETKVTVSYTVDGSLGADDSTPVLTMASFTAVATVAWADSAGNKILAPLPFTGDNLPDVSPNITIDVDPPTVTIIYASPDDQKLGVYDATHNDDLETEIFVQFSEVMADPASNIEVTLNTS